MSLLNFFRKNVDETADETAAEIETDMQTTECQEDSSPKPDDQDGWEWVEGYKGTNFDMTCKGFQYELNKEYTIEGKAILCDNGFHFCKKLGNVFNYYELKNNRFFKVKALVNMEEIKEMKIQREFANYGLYRNHYRYLTDDKLVAKKIILTEEVSFEELLPYIQRCYKYVETESDWKLLNEIGYENYRMKYFLNQMKDSGFSETFLLVLSKEVEDFDSIIELSRALKEENVSKDMAVYLILKRAREN